MSKIKRPNLKNCAKCGKVFVPIGGEKYCQDCKRKEEEQERQIANYVRDNPGVSIKEAAEATGVPERLVKVMALAGTFARRGKVHTHACMNCGKSITQGAYCSDCLAKLRTEAKRAGEMMKLRSRNEERGDRPMLDVLNEKAQREFELENSRRRYFSQGTRDKMFSNRR